MEKNSIVVCTTVCAHFVCACMNSDNTGVCTNNDCQTTGKTMAINIFSEKSAEDVKNLGKNVQKTQLQSSQRNNCLIPYCSEDRHMLNSEEKEALWDKYYTAAPARQRQCVAKFSIVKRA